MCYIFLWHTGYFLLLLDAQATRWLARRVEIWDPFRKGVSQDIFFLLQNHIELVDHFGTETWRGTTSVHLCDC
jgi:hypothetical protein